MGARGGRVSKAFWRRYVGVFPEQGVPLAEKEMALLFVSHHLHFVAVLVGIA